MDFKSAVCNSRAYNNYMVDRDIRKSKHPQFKCLLIKPEMAIRVHMPFACSPILTPVQFFAPMECNCCNCVIPFPIKQFLAQAFELEQ